MSLFEAKQIHKRFGQQVVLENIEMSFEANQLSGIMGPNGAGKTTLFNVLTGQYKPDRGHVIFDGEDITGQPEHVIAGKGISRSFQIMNLFDGYTVLQNVVVALPHIHQRRFNLFRNVPYDQEFISQGYEVLQLIGLADDAQTEARDLPYGKRRALEIGVALATNPKLLFLDEPTQGLGSEQIGNLAELIERLKEKVTMVIIEHDMSFLFQLADVISVVHWGQVISQGTPSELMQNKWVTASSLGKLQ
jgi:branched-chain amino acid transport system ATP-binding protein